MSNEHNVYDRLIVRWDTWSKQAQRPNDKGGFQYFRVKRPLTRKDIDESLLGVTKTIGVYTVKPGDNIVVNPTVDVDNHDGKTIVIDDVKKIYHALKVTGMYPYVEASAGELCDGAHVGVICKPIQAQIAKAAIKAVLDSIEMKHEVNPKQDTVAEGEYGNLVKLPFQFNNRTGKRSQIISPETWLPMKRPDAVQYMLDLPETEFKDVEISDDAGLTIEPQYSINAIGIDSLLSNKRMKPCVVKAHIDKWVLHGIGQEGHDFRYIIATELLSWNATDAEIQEFFSVQADYSINTVRDQLKQIRSRKYSPSGCKSIQKKCPSLVGSLCDSCTYYLKPKKNGVNKEKKKLGEIKVEVGEILAEGMGVYRGNLELAEEFQKVSPIYYDRSRCLWLWMRRDGYYKRIDETDILSAIRQRTEENVIDSKVASELVRALKITGREREVMDPPSTWVHTLGGIYDYITGERIEASPNYFLRSPIPHKVGLCENTPIMDKIFRQWIGDSFTLLYEWIAYCLVDSYPIHRMLILFGSGRNGKGQYADLVMRFIGMENMTAIELERLIESRFEAVKLYRKKAALVDETNFNAIKNTARIKAITGASPIGAEWKGKDAFDFYNTAKVMILTNNLPESLDKTEAFYGRCIIQEFKNRFDEGKPIIDTIPEIEYENLLYKCLKILPVLMERGRFTGEGTIEDKAIKYERISNPWTGFAEKELQEASNARTPVWVIFGAFVEFCRVGNYRVPTKSEVTRRIKGEGFEVKPMRFGERTWAGVYGLELRMPYVYEEMESKKNEEVVMNNVRDVALVRPPSTYQPCVHTLITHSQTSQTSATNDLESEDGVTESNSIIEVIKNKIITEYGKFNKPASVSDLEELRDSMELYILNEIDTEIPDDLPLRIINDYCHARGWQ